MKDNKKTAIILGIILTIIIIWRLFVLNNQVNNLNIQVKDLENKLASTTEEFGRNIKNGQNAFSDELSRQRRNVDTIEQTLGNYKEVVIGVSTTVATLEKISKTDPQLLAKYSKVFFLNENYAPSRLSEIPDNYRYSSNRVLKFQSQTLPYLTKMIDEANKSGIQIYAYSAYRSFNEQQALKKEYSVVYGAGTANTFSADQGYSEHQLGTTVDLITPGLGGSLDGFENTKAYVWMTANAYKYGFILSYPKNNKFYVFEPWHWRYVGVKLATYLHDNNKNFYDLDQREIDSYLVNFFD